MAGVSHLVEIEFNNARIEGRGEVNPGDDSTPFVDGDGRPAERAPWMTIHLESGTLMREGEGLMELEPGDYVLGGFGLARLV